MRRGGLAAVIIVFVLHHLQHQMMRPFLPLYASSLGVGYVGVGISAAALGLLPMLLAVPVGALSDRFGLRPLAAAGGVLSFCGYLLLWSVPTYTVLLACQLVIGFANLLVVLSVQAYVGSLGQGRAAERNFGTYTIYASFAQIIGPLLGGALISLYSYSTAFLLAASLSAASLVTGLAVLPRRTPAAGETSEPGERRLGAKTWSYARSRPTQVAILTSCLVSVPEVVRTSFLPVYLGAAAGLSTTRIGYIVTLFSVAGLIAKTVLPRLAARFGRESMMLVVILVCASTVAAIPLTTSPWLLGLITLLMGATFGLGRPLSMAMAANSAAPEDLGLVVGIRLTGNRFADFALPIALGSVATAAGLLAAFPFAAALMLTGSGFLLGPAAADRRTRRARQSPG